MLGRLASLRIVRLAMLIALIVSASVGVRVGAVGIVFSQGPNLGTYSVGWQEIPLIATGATGPYTWSVVSGSLPPGLSLRTDGPSWFPPTANAGIIGIATTPGTYNFTLHVVSTDLQTADQAATIKISPLISADTFTLPDAFVGASYSYQMIAQTNGGAATWTPTTLPPGMSLSPTGLLSGIPTTPGNNQQHQFHAE